MFICHGMFTVFTDIPKRHNIETTEEIHLRIETRVLFKNEPNAIKIKILSGINKTVACQRRNYKQRANGS